MHSCKPSKVHLTIADLVTASKSTSTLAASTLSRKVTNVWHDSRKVGKGDVFVALSSNKNDGHDFVRSAFKQGAVAAIVNKSEMSRFSSAEQKKLIAVSNPLKALAKIANDYRKRMENLIVGITGSNGKTTTRSFIAGVLGSYFNVGQTYTNWNNDIGVPLSLMRFKGNEVCGVIEMGANHVGEIGVLSQIASPDIAIITNIGYAHVGLFGGLNNTTQEKFEIIKGLNKSKGFILLNGDDSRLVSYAKKLSVPVIFFGVSKKCDIRATAINIGENGSTHFTVDGFEYELLMTGRHFVYCALPAIFLAQRVGVSQQEIAVALKTLIPQPMRGTIETKSNIRYILDCYNANPDSMDNALVLLADCAQKNKVAIIGDMLELGSYAQRLHVRLGKSLAKSDLRILITVGSFASCVAQAACNAGMSPKKVFTAATAHEASIIAQKVLRANDTVLIKGSRGIGLETVFEGQS